MQGELALFRRRGSSGDHRPSANVKQPTQLMAKLVMWLPKSERVKDRSGTLVVRTDPNSLVAYHMDGEEPRHIHADQAHRWIAEHRRKLSRMADDTKREKLRGGESTMRYTSCAVTLLVAASVMIGGSTAHAQERVRSASAVAAGLRTEFSRNVRSAAAILGQQGTVYSRQEQDAVADALVEVAIENIGKDNSAETARVLDRINDVLVQAALGIRGRPYPGASERFLRMALAGNHRAADRLARLPDQGDKLDYLRRLATAKEGDYQFIAIHGLAKMGPEGLEALREMHRQDLVVNRHAQCELREVAIDQGWKVIQYPRRITRNGRTITQISSGCHF